MPRSSRRRYLAAASGAVVSAAGCLDDVVPVSIGGTTRRLPDLLVLAEGQTDGANAVEANTMARLVHDPDEGAYRAVATHDHGATFTDAAPVGDGYVAVDRSRAGTSLLVLDDEMDERAQYRSNPRTAVAADGEYVYAASEDGFRVLDADLDEVSWVPLPEEFSGKHMEDVVLHDGSAYLVDDVWYPVYLFRVDVGDPADPTYVEVVETGGTHAGLDQQAIHPSGDRWHCLVTTSGRWGTAQHVLTTSLEGDRASETRGGIDVRSDESTNVRRVHEWDRDSGETTGVLVEDLTAYGPPHATVEDDGTYYLSSLSVDDDGSVSFGREVELAPGDVGGGGSAAEPSVTRVTTASGVVAAVAVRAGTSELTVYDREDDAVVLEQDLDVGRVLACRALGDGAD